jgi:hypothetical protein
MKEVKLIIHKIIIKVHNPRGNRFENFISFGSQWHNFYAIQGFPISGENLRPNNFVGIIVYYFEVQYYQSSKFFYKIGKMLWYNHNVVSSN